MSELTDRIDALYAKATAKPWNAAPHKADAEAVTVALIGDWRVEHPTPGIPGGNYRDTKWGNDVDDANLIAAIVNAWPQIKAEIERLEKDAGRYAQVRSTAELRFDCGGWVVGFENWLPVQGEYTRTPNDEPVPCEPLIVDAAIDQAREGK